MEPQDEEGDEHDQQSSEYENDQGQEEEGDEEQSEDEEIVAARELLAQKSRLKQFVERKRLREVAAGIRHDAPDVTTSDVEDEIKDLLLGQQEALPFSIGVHHKIVSKGKPIRKTLPDLNSESFEFELVEDSLTRDILDLVNGRDYVVEKRTMTVKAAKTVRYHDLEDFGLREIEPVNQLVRSVHEQHPRSKVDLTLEVRVKIVSLEESRRRKAGVITAREPGDKASSAFGSSPPQPLAKKQSQRTTQRQAESDVRLAQIQLAGNFEKQLVDRYRCVDRSCTNHDNFCFVDT